jgi:intracellular multiplication protein IcmE
MTGAQKHGGPDEREDLCKALGLGGKLDAHNLIASGARKGVGPLLQKGLNAEKLEKLGYGLAGMKSLGYGDDALAKLGFGKPAPLPPLRKPKPEEDSGPDLGPGAKIPDLIAAGHRAPKLKSMGITVHHCRKAGCTPTQLLNIGFRIDELAAAYTCAQLRRAGIRVGELQKFFSGQELRGAGFSATEMRMAGYGIKDLRRFGFSDNHIIGAGYSINELQREGLSRRTVDARKFK